MNRNSELARLSVLQLFMYLFLMLCRGLHMPIRFDPDDGSQPPNPIVSKYLPNTYNIRYEMPVLIELRRRVMLGAVQYTAAGIYRLNGICMSMCIYHR